MWSLQRLKQKRYWTLVQWGNLVPYSQVFCHEKQEDFGILHLQVYTSVIPARFWPESRDSLEWIPAKGMPE